jgi:hypothetical protein
MQQGSSDNHPAIALDYFQQLIKKSIGARTYDIHNHQGKMGQYERGNKGQLPAKWLGS